MNKTVKNVLATVGAVAIVKTAPVLAVGAAIGAVAANPEKVKKSLEDFAIRMQENADKWAEEVEAACNAACCCGEDECDCDCNAEPTSQEAVSAEAEAEPGNDETPPWEDDVPEEPKTITTDEALTRLRELADSLFEGAEKILKDAENKLNK